MPFFRKKPVVIEAIRWEGTKESFLEIKNFCPRVVDGGFVGASDNEDGKDSWPLFIYAKEGIMYAPIGDYIIKGAQGEFYQCRPDVFEKEYEPVNQPPKSGL